MPFKIKDLMIDVASTDVANRVFETYCRLPSVVCHYPTFQPCFAYTQHCVNFTCHGLTYVACQFGSITPTIFTHTGCGISEQPTGPGGPIDHGALKEQLRAQLAQVEAHEQAAGAAAQPQTREQAADLEEKLKGALDEVQRLKKTLPSGGSK
jgi:hypothetical protein